MGVDVEVGDLIDVGIKQRIGRVVAFRDRPTQHGISGRIAVTDIGAITLIDNQLIPVY